MIAAVSFSEITSAAEFIINYWWLVLILLGVAAIIIWAIVKRGMRAIFRGLWLLIKWLFIGLFYIIASPVFLIIGIVKLVRFTRNTERPKRRRRKKK